ncbi:hypothetical protein C8J56DRAFT_778814 [Mycena floridula]|nr:hypothetical protein C8J56DRAFT_778814 [Mycena floridula]
MPQPLPSLPPSPSSEEDLSRAQAWSESESSLTSKQKGKQRENLDAGDDEAGVYPPVNDDQAETRRVQENLRRMEMAERQRRKAARDSIGGSASLIADVGKLLWRTPSSRPPTDRSLGTHAALQSTDSLDILPLKSLADDNPFFNPAVESRAPGAVMTPYAEIPPQQDDSSSSLPPSRPMIVAANSSFSKPPPPQPLDIPPPKTPPPRLDSKSPVQALQSEEEEEKETRWWHDWLCGCGEGSDRGGENQASCFNFLQNCTKHETGGSYKSQRVTFYGLFLDKSMTMHCYWWAGKRTPIGFGGPV